MTRTTKVLLVASLVCLVVGAALNSGVVDTRGVTALYVILPVGGIFFGLFLLSKLLEKEAALYDEEQQTISRRANQTKGGLAEGTKRACCQPAEAKEMALS